ncbi:hypothetical protein DNL40_06355 [Xylanimonas oleitrophica]|uniref:Uncharacterized protein n=1 Tax=Xylanimonas oleitrophica TaxID=2607479 RepID=A0A2W5YGC3_9MICO|nr:hypothetical protein [Xylanimonas oleitrophica]PZR53741.1 hypothetical protein DNL40_06355 [Xylanimonas oleitrophica]
MKPRHGWRPLLGTGEVRLTGERPALRTRGGRFLRLHDVPAPAPVARTRYLHRVRQAVLALEEAEHARRWPPGRRRVLVLGHDRLARALTAALRGAGADVRRSTARAGTALLTSVDVVVDVRDTPHRPEEDSALDPLPSTGTALLRGRREGARMLLYPLAVDGTEATADQVRRRRLAASPAASELASWLARPHRRRRLRAAAVSLTVARCLAVLEDWAAGRPAVAEHRRLLRTIGEDLRETTHTVLGFDEPAPHPQGGRR